MFSMVRERFSRLWPYMGLTQKVKAIWLFYNWLAAERVANWFHVRYARMRAGKDGLDG